MPYYHKDEFEYMRVVMPQLVRDPSFVQQELEVDLQETQDFYHRLAKDDPDLRLCIGVGKPETDSPLVYGCNKYATKFTFLIYWLDLKKAGIPYPIRHARQFLIQTCDNCWLLMDSKKGRCKSVWIKKVAASVHLSPYKVRTRYHQAYSDMEDVLREPRSLANDYMLTLIKQVNHQKVYIHQTLGQLVQSIQEYTAKVECSSEYIRITNIDTSNLKLKGEITITTFNI